PPNDNFFKFFDIGGLVTMIFGLFIIYKNDNTETDLLLKQQVQERILSKEVSLITEELDYNVKFKRLNDSVTEKFQELLEKAKGLTKDTIYKKIIYNLPDSLKNRFKELMLKDEELKANRTLISSI